MNEESVLQEILSWKTAAPGAFIASILFAVILLTWRWVIKPAIELGAELRDRKK